MESFMPKFLWHKEEKDAIYITFDDGPHPEATIFALDQLQRYEAKATFFCIGNNVRIHKSIYDQILAQGHTIGNHTNNHINGWKNTIKNYVIDVHKAKQVIDTPLFRPPYGRIRPLQAKQLIQQGYTIVMWSLLSGDFDTNITPEECWENVRKNVKPGDIIVFHDSTKAYPRMKYALVELLKFAQAKRWRCLSL